MPTSCKREGAMSADSGPACEDWPEAVATAILGHASRRPVVMSLLKIVSRCRAIATKCVFSDTGAKCAMTFRIMMPPVFCNSGQARAVACVLGQGQGWRGERAEEKRDRNLENRSLKNHKHACHIIDTHACVKACARRSPKQC
eukprot:2169083-Alexandrium_andersonii.AAC.1